MGILVVCARKKQLNLPLTPGQGASVFFPHGNLFFPIFGTAQIFFTLDGLLSDSPAARHCTAGSGIDACGAFCRAATGLRIAAKPFDPDNFFKKCAGFVTFAAG
ncbi:MAG: hypothetical protein JRH12_00930 [Deltaproteobacteria bacterium]|jgi:hypothetical protein|nr:hypothetical protein [Deltaproteobacteria bacterium]